MPAIKQKPDLEEEKYDGFFYPEKDYFRNMFSVGRLPEDITLNQFFEDFSKIQPSKPGVARLVPDLLESGNKAVILVFKNKKVAQEAYSKASKLISETGYKLYSGIEFFNFCVQLDNNCQPKLRNVFLSNFDRKIPSELFLNYFLDYGTIVYVEYITDNDIPYMRVEFTRLSSALAAVFDMQGVLSSRTLIRLEEPLFLSPVAPRTRN